VRTTALTLEEGPPSEVSGTGLEQLEKQLNGQAEITVSDSNDPLDSVPAVLTEALVPGGSQVGAMIVCDYPQCSVMLLQLMPPSRGCKNLSGPHESS